MAKRMKLRFPSNESMNAADAIETPGLEAVVKNERRNFVSVEIATLPEAIDGREAVTASYEVAPSLSILAESYGAELVEDYQYDLEEDEQFSFENTTHESAEASLDDVLQMINCEPAWEETTGKDVILAIVDTGIDGSHPEFPDNRKFGHWEAIGETPWTDWEGHGTMCAAIAAAGGGAGSRYRGVAPDCDLIACKTRFFDSELASIYDYLIAQMRETGRTVVSSNSFGRKTGNPPPDPSNSDFIPALNDAIDEGMVVFFSAGNNHQRVGGSPSQCSPNSVWLHKGRDDVFPVATCGLDRGMWNYSSRGPGQHFGDPGTSPKPDATAPTPRNGKILYGAGERVLPNGWGTSGACPQVAGLAALMLEKDPTLDRVEIFNRIRNSASPLGHGQTCEGAGLIDCGATIFGMP